MPEILNPYDGAVVGEYSPADLPSVRCAVDAGHAAFERTRYQAGADRSAVLLRISQFIMERQKNLAQLITAEAGKPILASLIEVQRAADTFRLAAQESTKLPGRDVDFEASIPGRGHAGVAQKMPIGLILGISPFNFPLNLVAHKIAPCIASGNTMLLKPSPRTPLTASALAGILAEADMLENQIQILSFDHQLIPSLLEDPRIKMLTFTGSAAVGWDLKRLAVKQKVTLELGGNAAVIVHSDAAWREAVPSIASGAYGFAGQSCISIQRILVQESIYKEFRDAFVEHTRALVTGNPNDVNTINGPLIDSASRDRLLAWTQEAIDQGAVSALPLRHEGNCLWPIILENVPADARIRREEAFGPVAILSRYEHYDRALAEVNDSRYGLQAGVFIGTADRARFARLAGRAFDVIDAGAILINEVPTFRVENMPYGGVKDSGFGREGISYAIEEMTEWKLLVNRPPAP
jgi:acyl-CoA reductase-like NAD-dependent aldehyde dehydrogenase